MMQQGRKKIHGSNISPGIVHLRECPWMTSSSYLPSSELWEYSERGQRIWLPTNLEKLKRFYFWTRWDWEKSNGEDSFRVLHPRVSNCCFCNCCITSHSSGIWNKYWTHFQIIRWVLQMPQNHPESLQESTDSSPSIVTVFFVKIVTHTETRNSFNSLTAFFKPYGITLSLLW